MTAAVWVALAIGIVSAVINTVSIRFAFTTIAHARLRDNSDRAWRRATWTMELLSSDDPVAADAGAEILSVIAEEHFGDTSPEIDIYDRNVIQELLRSISSNRTVESAG